MAEGRWFDDDELVVAFEVPSQPGSEREVRRRVAEVAAGAGAQRGVVHRLELAVSEIARNAAEHGNRDRPELPVEVEVRVADDGLAVRISDRGIGGLPPPGSPPRRPLYGRGEPRGFGLALVGHLVDEVRATRSERRHTVELVVRLEGSGDRARRRP